jgi:predicted GIY-YIG superfamily endonuclease
VRSQGEYKYWVYIMSSLSGTLYIGVTGELYARVFQHKAGEIEDSQRPTSASGWSITKRLMT